MRGPSDSQRFRVVLLRDALALLHEAVRDDAAVRHDRADRRRRCRCPVTTPVCGFTATTVHRRGVTPSGQPG